MKKRLCCILMIIMLLSTLCGCGEEEIKWPGYAGTLENYEYYYAEERNRAWEEDVLSLAENFLQYHPLLINEETKMFVLDRTDWENLFDEALYSSFLEEINLLIPEISKLSDTEILFRLQKTVAGLGDAHSQILLSTEPFFPLFFMPFYTGDGIELRTVACPAEQSDLIYSELVAINGVTTEEILKRMFLYISYESDSWAVHMCTSDIGGNWIRQKDMLEIVGVLEKDSDAAEFEFRTEDGQSITVELSVITPEEYWENDMIRQEPYVTYTLLYTDWYDSNYWYKMLPEEDTLYIRIARFRENQDLSLLRMSEKIIKDIGKSDGVGKVVVDLRNNVGGAEIEGYKRFFQALSVKSIGKVYVLIDEGTFSKAVAAAYRIKQDIDGAVLVGTPAGQGAIAFAHTENCYQTMPNCGVNYYIGTLKDIYSLNDEKVLVPDILVYPTFEDYKNGVDTVLEYVLEIEP